MRYDTPVYFQMITSGEYDAASGNYADGTITETKRFASVQPTNTNTMHLVYGTIKEDSLTVCLQTAYKEPFDCVRIGEKIYAVDSSRKQRFKQSFVVSEVQ